MTRRNTLKYSLTAALAASAVAASPALARPIDTVDRSADRTSSLAGTTSSPHQDYRGERAQDAAWQAAHPQPKFQPGQPTWSLNPAPLPKPEPATPATANGGGGDDDVWLVLGIGLAGIGLAAAGTAGLARQSRVRGRRVAV